MKKRLVAEKDLSKVQDYFFKNFVERGTFMSMGRQLAKGERRTLIIKALAEGYAGLSNELVVSLEAIFVEIPQYRLIHGTVMMNGKQGSVLYFEDVGVGLFTLVWDPHTGETKYVRFVTRQPETTRPN